MKIDIIERYDGFSIFFPEIDFTYEVTKDEMSQQRKEETLERATNWAKARKEIHERNSSR